MSAETIETLNRNTVQGYGVKAWHFKEGVSREPFPDAVPETVVSDLFPRLVETSIGHQAPGGDWVIDPTSKGLTREDTGDLLGIVSEAYAPHQYAETLLGMGLPIASAGLLRGGRHAWVQYGTADTVVTPENVKFTTKLLTVTSADATLATQFRYVTTLAVCDNTLASALKEGKDTVQRVRHTRFSVPRVDSMRNAFGLIDNVAESVTENISRQIDTTVTDEQISKFLDSLLPASMDSSDVEGRAKTIAVNKRNAVEKRRQTMWAEFANTQFGLLQALDTAARWDFRTTDTEKVMSKTISGEFDRGMADASKVLDLVLA